jgi:signal transduction histidine kinase
VKALRLILVEDSDDDAVLLLRALRAGGFEVDHRRVWNREELQAALGEGSWDLVISDYTLPAFDAPDALSMVRAHAPDLPFIVVSGTVGEDLTVAAIKAGAQDYLMKDKLARLPISVERELREARERAQHRAARAATEQALIDKRRAEASSLAKTRFLAHMSHELRTPLNAILGFSELLEQELAGPLTEQQREFVGHVLTGGRHLLRLITDILDLSKIEAGKLELELERVAFETLATGVGEILYQLAGERGVQLTLDIPAQLPELTADPVRLKQILYNLLSNGIKFTSLGGHVALRTEVVDDEFVIRIADTGSGIAPEDLPKLFNEFEQATSDSHAKARGTGLGLALTRRLVELHGGTIEVDSELGCGSTFCVRLPLSGPARSAGNAASTTTRTPP